LLDVVVGILDTLPRLANFCFKVADLVLQLVDLGVLLGRLNPKPVAIALRHSQGVFNLADPFGKPVPFPWWL
jgi:hypothetical protein